MYNESNPYDIQNIEKRNLSQEMTFVNNLVPDTVEQPFDQKIFNHDLENTIDYNEKSNLLLKIAYKLFLNKENACSNPEMSEKVNNYLKSLKEQYTYNKEFELNNLSTFDFLSHNLLICYLQNGSNVLNQKIFFDFVERIYKQLTDKTSNWGIKFESQDDFKREKIYTD